MSEFTQGVCSGGAAILKDGVMLTIEEIIELLQQGDRLMGAGEPVAILCHESDEFRDTDWFMYQPIKPGSAIHQHRQQSKGWKTMPVFTHPAPAVIGEPVAWMSADRIPELKAGVARHYVVAIKRANGNIYSFPAVYMNRYELCATTDNESASGNLWSLECPEDDDGPMIATGWFEEKGNPDYDEYFEPLLSGSCELVAWCEIPKYTGHPAPAVDGAVLMDSYQALVNADRVMNAVLNNDNMPIPLPRVIAKNREVCDRILFSMKVEG